jgi:hypothetical protein
MRNFEQTAGSTFPDRVWLPILLALGGILVLFHAFFFQGYVLDANHDRRDISVPFALLCQRASHSLTVPAWNPYIFAGTSALGSAAYVCFYPINWIAFAFPETFLPWLLSAILIVHVGLAFWFAYRLFLRLGGDPFWATLAATLYVFSSAAVMQMTAEINFTAFVYLPLVLYFVAAPSDTGFSVNVLGQAVAYALLILGGNPQLAVYAIGIAVGFALDRGLALVGPGRRVDHRALLRNAGALALGLLLAAPRLLPFYHSVNEAGGARVTYDAFRAMAPTRPTDTLRFLLPEIYGSSLHQSFFGTLNHFETFSAYVGVSGGILALYAVLFVWKRRTAFWNIAFLAIVLVVLGTPLTWIHYVATGGAQLLYNRLAWFLPICSAALVAAHGADMLPRRGLRVFSLVVLLTVAAALGYLVAWVPEAVLTADQETAMTAAAAHFGLFFLLFFAAITVAARAGARHALAGVLLLGPLACDLFLIAGLEASNSHPFLSPPPFFQPTSVEVRAAKHLGRAGAERRQRVFRIPPDARTSSYDKQTINNRFMYLGLYNSSGYDNYAPHRITRLYSYPSTVSRAEERIISPGSPRVAELTATSLAITDTALIELERALPRARLFTHYEVMPDNQALARVLDPAFDPLLAVVLSREPDRPIVPETEPGTADIVSDTGDRIEMRVTARSANILLLADTYDSGWRAEVDGVRAPVIVANYAFRAVVVPAGPHVVVWRFRHPGAVVGAWLGVAGLIACATLGAAALVSRRQVARLREDTPSA